MEVDQKMSINLVEEKIIIFFEVIELITDFNWKNDAKNHSRLEQLNAAYEDISPLKTMANLDANRKIRGTPAPQLYDFLTSIYEFVGRLLSKIHGLLLKIYHEINTEIFNLLTTPLRLENCLNNLQTIQKEFPELDYQFSRFFYQQILSNWLDIDHSMFDRFLTDAQKLRQTIPNLLTLFQHSVLIFNKSSICVNCFHANIQFVRPLPLISPKS